MKLALRLKRQALLDLPVETMDEVERRFVKMLDPNKGIEPHDAEWLKALWAEYVKGPLRTNRSLE